ncbi:hypothetical protein PBI_TRISCUIT_88 [Microbacterium phage Triscuit]|nr:hypothetical protein PBI_TRISCUIT_88 [Microbacterium phage Triscuit]
MSEMLENATRVAEFLKTEVDRSKFEEGTVLTFERTIGVKPSAIRGRRRIDPFDEEDDEEYGEREGDLKPEYKTFKYATMFVNGRWYFTGAGDLGVKKLKTRELLEKITDGEFSNIQVATGFMPIGD